MTGAIFLATTLTTSAVTILDIGVNISTEPAGLADLADQVLVEFGRRVVAFAACTVRHLEPHPVEIFVFGFAVSVTLTELDLLLFAVHRDPDVPIRVRFLLAPSDGAVGGVHEDELRVDLLAVSVLHDRLYTFLHQQVIPVLYVRSFIVVQVQHVCHPWVKMASASTSS